MEMSTLQRSLDMLWKVVYNTGTPRRVVILAKCSRELVPRQLHKKITLHNVEGLLFTLRSTLSGAHHVQADINLSGVRFNFSSNFAKRMLYKAVAEPTYADRMTSHSPTYCKGSTYVGNWGGWKMTARINEATPATMVIHPFESDKPNLAAPRRKPAASRDARTPTMSNCNSGDIILFLSLSFQLL